MSSKVRLASIDQFRGMAILLMVLANYGAGVRRVPVWLKHAPDVGLTVTDLVAPFFIFAIGLTYGLSIQTRAGRDGWRKAVEHTIRRYLSVASIGFLLSAGGIATGLTGDSSNWGVLQAIGVSGLLTLWVIRCSPGCRAIIGLALLGGYQVLLNRFWLASVLHSPHGGLQGALAWTAMLILATVLADLFYADRLHPWRFPMASLVTLLVGLGISFWAAISKNRVSASYVLVSLGISALVFWCLDGLSRRYRLRLAFLVAWGENPLLLYVLHILLLAVFVMPDILVPRWYTQAPLWLAALQAAGLVGVLHVIAWRWHRTQWRFAL